jgi:serine beta-lactamase-like protein LACTB, mitochondrial
MVCMTKINRKIIGSALCVMSVAIAPELNAFKAKDVSAKTSSHNSCSIMSLETRLTEITADMARDPAIVGVSSAIGVKGRVEDKDAVMLSTAGLADKEQAVAMTSDHVIAIGSISKLLAVGALARLVDTGKTSFDADIRPLVPRLSEDSPKITFAQLAAHTAGVRHYVTNDRFYGPQPSVAESRSIQYKTVDQALELFADDALLFSPGEKQYYSSYGYTLMSAAMERVGGKDFPSLVRDHVTTPLAMAQTQPNDVHTIIPIRARGYQAEGGTVKNAPAHNPSYVWAGGGYSSTPRDLVRFALAHNNASFLTDASRKALFTPQKLNDGQFAINGVGWEVRFDEFIKSYVESEDAASYREEYRELIKSMPLTVFHAGSVTGGHGLLIYIPRSGVAAVYLSNSNGPDVDKAATRMAFDLMRVAKDGDTIIQNCKSKKRQAAIGIGALQNKEQSQQ